MKFLKTIISILIFAFCVIFYTFHDKHARLNYSLPNNYIINSKEESTIFREKDYDIIKQDKIKNLSLLDKIIYSFDFLEELLIFILSLLIFLVYQKNTQDRKVSILILSIGFLSLVQVYIIFFENFYFIYFTLLFFIGFLILNLSFRFFGKELSNDFFILEILVCFSIIFLFWEYIYIQKIDFIFEKITTYGLRFIAFSSFLCIIAWFFNLIKKKFYTSRIKNFCVLISLIFISLIPYFLLQINFHISLLDLRKFVFLFLFILLILFGYGNYKPTLLLVKIPINYLIIPFLVVFLFLLSYFSIIKVLKILYLYERFYEIFTIYFLIFCSFYLSKIKKLVESFINYSVLKFNTPLEESLRKIIHISVEPNSLENRINKINTIVKNLLKIEKILILVPQNEFEEVESKKLIKIKEKSDIWQYFSKQIDIIFKDTLIDNQKIIKNIYDFFLNYNINIGYPILEMNTHKNVGFLLLGKKQEECNFLVSEFLFLKKYSQIIERLFNHYKLIKNQMDKKKTITALNETLNLNKKNLNKIQTNQNEFIKFSFINKASIGGVSGDYINIFFKDKTLYFFVGDICGHGLSTSYLNNALNGLIDFQINLGYNLSSVFHSINDFFLKRYKSYEFLTLIGGFYNFDTQDINFINAGHLPLIKITSSGNIVKHASNQPAIGLLDSNYKIETIKNSIDDKIFIFTDGITETMSKDNELFGEKRFLDFLKNNYKLNYQNMIEKLEETIFSFSESKELNDDLSFVCLHTLSQS